MKVEKVVGNLPSTLAPNTLYMVRVGAGFDLYESDATGAVAHPVNTGREFALPPDLSSESSETHFFIGWASLGSGWEIRRQVRETGQTESATGTSDFTAAWSGREALAYS